MDRTSVPWRVLLGLALSGAAILAATWTASCAGAAPAPTPTVAAKPTAAPAQAAPTKGAEPTKAQSAPTQAAAQPTAVPVKKVDFPEKGKSITFIVPYPPGGSTDASSRLLAPLIEQELGVPVPIVNKGGAGTQIGMTDLAKSKPDGYTIGLITFPGSMAVYVDPRRQAVFGRKDLQLIANYVSLPTFIAVKADSPYKSVKDLVDAARANPEKIKIGDSGLLTGPHVAVLLLNKVAGVKFASVHFEGGAASTTAALGGHVDATSGNTSVILPHAKSGAMRVLGVMDPKRNDMFPEYATFKEQGFDVEAASEYGLAMPAGAPKEVVNILSAAVKKALANQDLQKKNIELGQFPNYMDADTYSAHWDKNEALLGPMIALAE